MTAKKTTAPKPAATEPVAPVLADNVQTPVVVDAPAMSDDVADDLTQETCYRIAALRSNGFWRCGRKWLAEGVVLTLHEIGGAEVLILLKAEPMLVVTQVGGE